MADKSKSFDLQLTVGLFMVAGIMALVYLSIQLGEVNLFGNDTYQVKAIFSSVQGLKPGTSVEIAGVQVGKVEGISLEDYEAVVTMSIQGGVQLQDDVIASVRTKGLLGEKYISISPGGSDRIIKPGGKIRETQPPINMEEIMSKYVFGKV